MCDLETANRSLLGALMCDIAAPIDTLQQRSVARWALKTAMVFEFMVSRRKHPFYTRQEREQLRSGNSLPIDTAVLPARNAGNLDLGWVGMDAWYDKPEKSENLHVYVTTLIVKHLVIQILSAHITGNLRGPVRVTPQVAAP